MNSLKTSVLAAAVVAASLAPVETQAASVHIWSVTGTVTGLDFQGARIESALPYRGFTSLTRDRRQPLSYYGLSDGFFSTDVGGAVNGSVTVYRNARTSALSLQCSFSQYNVDLCGGELYTTPVADENGIMTLLAGDDGHFARIEHDGRRASMVYENDLSFGGVTEDGREWFGQGLAITWDLTLESSPGVSAREASLVVTPLPSSALLLLTPLALVAWRRRRGQRPV
ncbi:MAG: hypothetical protein V2I76_00860 [Roseobacter sp.]|jgi:hypothetical protein|nr:hypothetical protein [Roseobacter sp.]